MSILKEIEKDLQNNVKEAGYEVEKLAMEESNRRDLGEYQLNDAMQLAKKYHENPREIATKIVKVLEKNKNYTNINIAGPGFINISLSMEYKKNILNRIKDNLYENIDKKTSKKIIIDYGGANVAKALHVGHLRSANIGESLKRLAKLLGYEVLGDAHLGDYGRPLGLVILEIKKRYPNLPYFDKNYTGDYQKLSIPITNEDLEKIYPLASKKAKEDEKYLEEGRIITSKIQDHEKGYYDLWKKVVDISKEDIKKVYETLNTNFELWLGESDAAEYFDDIKNIFEKEKLLIKSEGALIVDVSQEDDKAPMPPLLFVKSNGTISYETTDLASIYQREVEYSPDEIWYVVDGRQSLHFTQVFRAAKKAELTNKNTKLEHIGFGTMNGTDGKPFKTRDGGVMGLKTLMDIVVDETRKKINPETVPEEEREEVAKKVAIAALKYADLLPHRATDYIFEVEKFSDLEGKTGPYILYSTIRMKSLLEKAKLIKAEKITKLKGNAENNIILTILNLPNALNRSLESRSLNELAEYIYRLTSQYNTFYSENKIITEKDKELRNSWIVLTKIVYSINKMLLDILAIDIPNKM